MPSSIVVLKNRKVLLVWIALVHLASSAALWFWAFTIGMGLGFKDPAKWTTFDHIQASLIPKLAFSITLPGRLISELTGNGFVFLAAIAANSFLWATLIVYVYGFVTKYRNAA